MLPKGINVGNYIKLIPAWKHIYKPTGIHTGPANFNKAWRMFFESTDRRTAQDIINFMYELDKRYHITDYKWIGR